MVMQSLESAVESRKQALRLLNIALWEERWDLTRDLIRFLEVFIETVAFISCSTRPRPTRPRVHERPQLPRSSMVRERCCFSHKSFLTKCKGISEQLLGSHARKLLGNGQLSLLGRFAESLQFPLIEWLAENRCA